MQTERIWVWISRILISNRIIQKPLAPSLSLSRRQKRSFFKLLIWQESIWIQSFDECLPPSLEWNQDSDVSKICWIESFGSFCLHACVSSTSSGTFTLSIMSWNSGHHHFLYHVRLCAPHIIKKCKLNPDNLLYTTIQSLGSSFERN